MLVEKEIKKIFQKLLQDDIIRITLDGFDILVRVLEGPSKLILSTQVYFGGNFIPKSVRKCVSDRDPFISMEGEHIKTQLIIDEEHFLINLNFIGGLENLNNESFRLLLEDFTWLANKWRDNLDEHDRNDLVHVRVK